ncbi:MAG: hypothetical protein WED11_07700 [Natronospirillum sp.]
MTFGLHKQELGHFGVDQVRVFIPASQSVITAGTVRRWPTVLIR